MSWGPVPFPVSLLRPSTESGCRALVPAAQEDGGHRRSCLSPHSPCGVQCTVTTNASVTVRADQEPSWWCEVNELVPGGTSKHKTRCDTRALLRAPPGPAASNRPCQLGTPCTGSLSDCARRCFTPLHPSYLILFSRVEKKHLQVDFTCKQLTWQIQRMGSKSRSRAPPVGTDWPHARSTAPAA